MPSLDEDLMYTLYGQMQLIVKVVEDIVRLTRVRKKTHKQNDVHQQHGGARILQTIPVKRDKSARNSIMSERCAISLIIDNIEWNHTVRSISGYVIRL